LKYGTTPEGTFQTIPEDTRAPELKVGQTYQLYVLRDVGVPIANCLFTFGEEIGAEPAGAAQGGEDPGPGQPVTAAGSCELPGGDADGFGATCKADADCTCKASYCALMPGQAQGTCTVMGCKQDQSLCPTGFSCFDLSMFSPDLPSICTKS
jgi:hypothetical protein